MGKQTQDFISTLKAIRADVKESSNIEVAIKKIDELLLVANLAEKAENAEKGESDVQDKSERWKISIQPEQITLMLPKAALGFYRFYARIHNSTVEDELTLDILRKLRQDFVEIDFEELFGLDRVFEKYGIQEVPT